MELSSTFLRSHTHNLLILELQLTYDHVSGTIMSLYVSMYRNRCLESVVTIE